MTLSPEAEKALRAVANMGLTKQPFELGQPLRHRGSPDLTHYIPVGISKCGTVWWAECVAESEPRGRIYEIECRMLYDPYPLLGERGRLTVTGEFLRVIDGGLA